MKKTSTRALNSVLDQSLEQAGGILRRHFGRVRARYKGKANLVTQADYDSQAAILGLIKKNFPDHDYCSEESARRITGSDYIWVIDPLDGTTNYAHDYPVACVSIGLIHRDKPLLAGVYDPFRDECFKAEAGCGTRLNGKTVKVSTSRRLESSLLITGFAYDRIQRSRFYIEFYRNFMVRCHDVRRSGSAALDMAWIAAGRADGFWEFKLNAWDVAAGLLLVREGGGKVSDFSGKDWNRIESYGQETLATNGLIHAEMLANIAVGAK